MVPSFMVSDKDCRGGCVCVCVYLLEGENIRAESQPFAFIALDGFGDIWYQNSTWDGDVTNLIIAVNGNEPRIIMLLLLLLLLAVLETQIDGQIISQPD